MKVVVMYDVNTKDVAGRRRIQLLAKHCLNWGTRIQNSVYECEVNSAQYRDMVRELSGLLNAQTDCLRFYNLGNHSAEKILHIGATLPEVPAEFIL